jgi:dTDP-4-amino-4,6-dideoxygalactose transaminase
MDGIQAAILSTKLDYLAEWTGQRQINAKSYDDSLKKADFKTIIPSEKSEPVYHLYVVEVSNRDEVVRKMTEAGIETGVHYPLPLHKQPAFTSTMRVHNHLPVTENAADRIMSLPMCGSLTEDEVQRVIDVFLKIAHP